MRFFNISVSFQLMIQSTMRARIRNKISLQERRRLSIADNFRFCREISVSWIFWNVTFHRNKMAIDFFKFIQPSIKVNLSKWLLLRSVFLIKNLKFNQSNLSFFSTVLYLKSYGTSNLWKSYAALLVYCVYTVRFSAKCTEQMVEIDGLSSSTNIISSLCS